LNVAMQTRVGFLDHDRDPLRPLLGDLDDRWLVAGRRYVVLIDPPAHYLLLEHDDDSVCVSDNMTEPTPLDAYKFADSPVYRVWLVSDRLAFARLLAERREHYARSLRG
jgi:hypothetical protein